MTYKKPEIVVLGDATDLIQSIKGQGSELVSPQDMKDPEDCEFVG